MVPRGQVRKVCREKEFLVPSHSHTHKTSPESHESKSLGGRGEWGEKSGRLPLSKNPLAFPAEELSRAREMANSSPGSRESGEEVRKSDRHTTKDWCSPIDRSPHRLQMRKHNLDTNTPAAVLLSLFIASIESSSLFSLLVYY